MFYTVLSSVVGAFIAAACFAGLRRARVKETDATGRAVLRYLVAPYAMFVCSVALSAFAISQWFDPTNHQYSGNLVMLSYLPAFIGVMLLAFAVHLLSFRVTLTSKAIELYSWPFGHKTYLLRDLEAIEAKEPNTVLRFKHSKRFVVYSMYSGSKYFLSALSANNSIQRTQTRSAGSRR